MNASVRERLERIADALLAKVVMQVVNHFGVRPSPEALDELRGYARNALQAAVLIGQRNAYDVRLFERPPDWDPTDEEPTTPQRRSSRPPR